MKLRKLSPHCSPQVTTPSCDDDDDDDNDDNDGDDDQVNLSSGSKDET